MDPIEPPTIEDDPAPWYASRGIPIGLAIWLAILTVAVTAYLTNIADRTAVLEANLPVASALINAKEHSEIASRLSVLETQIKEIQKDLNGKSLVR